VPSAARLKARVKNRAYYWPTADRLSFKFAHGMEPEDLDYGDDEEPKKPSKPPGFSSGERQIRALREIVEHTAAQMYLHDSDFVRALGMSRAMFYDLPQWRRDEIKATADLL
jgi:hypothetical protein